MKRYIFLLLIIVSVALASGTKESELEIHLFSYHTNKIYSNSNFGIGYNWNYNKNLQVNTGYYKNSEKRDTFYVGGTSFLYQNNNFKFGIGGILATGYSYYAKSFHTYTIITKTNTCTTNSFGDMTCRTTKTINTKNYPVSKRETKFINPIFGLVAEYRLNNVFSIKTLFSSDRFFNKKMYATDLFHFSLLIKL